MTAERRQFRERIRCEAGERFTRDEKNVVIAKDLRVSERSVERWRRAWREGGMEALVQFLPIGAGEEGPYRRPWRSRRWMRPVRR